MDYSYDTRIVCFIDILGFSSIIKETSKRKVAEPLALFQVCEAIKMINSFGDIVKNEVEIEGLMVTQFSDSIVISFPWKENSSDILLAFSAIRYMQVYLIKEFNILMRGGIVIGEVIHDNEILVGPAMIAAYELESKCAVYPRIVIDPKVAYRYRKTLNQFKKEWDGDSVIHKELDDTYYIDYFNIHDNDGFAPADVLDYFRRLCNMVAKFIESADMSIRIKYLWMRNKIKASTLYEQPEYAHIYKELVTDKRK